MGDSHTGPGGERQGSASVSGRGRPWGCGSHPGPASTRALVEVDLAVCEVGHLLEGVSEMSTEAM